jgi:hypothetical protein
MLNNVCMEDLKHQIYRKKGEMHGRIGKQQSREVLHAFGCLVYFSGTGMMLGVPKRFLWCSWLTRDLAMFQRHGYPYLSSHIPVLSSYSTSRGAASDAKGVWIVF